MMRMRAYFKVLYSVLLRLAVLPFYLIPVKKDVVLFTGLTGAGNTDYSCNPKYIYRQLKREKIRVELDDRNEKIGYKIRYARQVDKVPYMIIVGEKEVAEQTISVRDRATDQTTAFSLSAFIDSMQEEIRQRSR